MTVFLTPDGRPYYAGTYFPPEPRGGLPGFADLCRALADAYAERRDDVVAQADTAVGRIAAAAERVASADPDAPALDAALLDDAMLGLARAFDPVQGGFGGAPKFPPSLALEFLAVRAARPGGDRHAREMLEITLARMAAGGIHDQLGGGFHRYAVDAQWLVPHFEKMLYDSALLGRVYAQAFHVTGTPDHGHVAQWAFDYLLREMRLPGGGFAAAQDADSEGGEGAFFTWTPEQLAQVLDADQLRAVTARYGVHPEGNWEGVTILRPVASVASVSQEIGQDATPLLIAAHKALYRARAARPAPARDDKVIAAWNGLAIAGLADAGRLLGRDDYIDAAVGAAAFVLDALVVDGRLHRAHMEGRAVGLGHLDDHADMCHGLLALYDATFQPRWVDEARRLAERMVDLFDDGQGGFYYAASDGDELICRTRDVEDHPTPSGNSQAARVLLRLADLGGDPGLERRALSALERVRGDVVRMPHAFGTALVTVDRHLASRRQIVVVGAPDDERTGRLVGVARTGAGPHDTLVVAAPDDPAATAAVPLLQGRGPVDGAPAAYVCRNFTCRAPITDPDALAAELADD